jgi:hypothetical protein
MNSSAADKKKKELRAKGGIFSHPLLSSLSTQKGNLWLSRTCTALLDRQKKIYEPKKRADRQGGKATPSLCSSLSLSTHSKVHNEHSMHHHHHLTCLNAKETLGWVQNSIPLSFALEHANFIIRPRFNLTG